MRWTVVVPLKGLPAANSRLHAALASPDTHRRLTEAMRADTLAAAAAAGAVARLLVVTDDPPLADNPALAGLAAHVLVQQSPGLNGALAEAARYAAEHWPVDGVALLVGDLPALRAADLDDALDRAAPLERALVADADGAGTTLLTAGPGIAPVPQFGAGSAARHAVRAYSLPAAPGLRRDVDTLDDLHAARALGLGPATAAALLPDAVAG